VKEKDPNLKDKKEDTDAEKNMKESMRLKLSEDWFSFTKLYRLDKEIKAEFITQFSKNLESFPSYFESEKTPVKKYSEKVVGEDMRKRLFESDEDCIVYLKHPIKEKNKNYDEIFERYAKTATNAKPMWINKINETEVYKFTQKAPTVLLFKAGQKESPKELDIRRDLVSNPSIKEAVKWLREFS
jgi:hypothetical protein